MFKKPSKKRYIIQRVLLAVVATVSVIVIVTVAILFMLGYRLDSGNGKLEQGALLQFDSTPNGATVTVDGQLVSGQTANKQTVIAGTHAVSISKSGYETWNRTLTLEAGTLTWLDYIRLVPKTRNVETVNTYQSLAGFSVSPDQKWALAQEKADTPTLQLIDLRSDTVTSSTLTLPASLYSDATTDGATHQFSLKKWSDEGRYILLTHTYTAPAGSGQTEWLMVDTQDLSKSVNITQLLSVGFKDIQFAGTSGTNLFGLTNDGVVRKLDLSAGTISRSFITNVSSFNVFDGNIISYVGVNPSNTTQQVAGVYRDGEESPHVLRTVKDLTTPLYIATGRYFGNDYVAIAEGLKVTILTGSYPTSSNASDSTSSLSQFATMALGSNATALSFSSEGSYVLAQSGAQFESYEIEHKRVATAAIAVIDEANAHTLQWLDIAHLWNDDDGNLVMRDFNGLNAQTIMTVAPGFGASLSQNGRYFYGIGKTDSGYHLQRVKMILS